MEWMVFNPLVSKKGNIPMTLCKAAEIGKKKGERYF